MSAPGGRSRFAGDAEAELQFKIETGAIPEEQFNEGSSWAAVDLEPAKRGEQTIQPPSLFTRADGECLIYPGRPHVFFGESESLKSWAALVVCREVLAKSLTALYIDFESSELTFVERCKHVGIPDEAIGGALHYVRPAEPLTGSGSTLARSDFVAELGRTNGLVVLDGVTEAYALHQWNINDAEDAARFQMVFSVEGPATIAIDHTAKDAGRGQIGSQHKRAGLDGAQYEFRSVVRGGRGGVSIAEVNVTKDRHGYVRGWAQDDHVGDLCVDELGVKLNMPAPPRDNSGAVREAVLTYIGENPGCGASKVRTGVGGRAGAVDAVVRGLLAEGLITDRGTEYRHLYYLAE